MNGNRALPYHEIVNYNRKYKLTIFKDLKSSSLCLIKPNTQFEHLEEQGIDLLDSSKFASPLSDFSR